jgi:hypothetical protein
MPPPVRKELRQRGRAHTAARTAGCGRLYQQCAADRRRWSAVPAAVLQELLRAATSGANCRVSAPHRA